jgi:hypothetical protein
MNNEEKDFNIATHCGWLIDTKTRRVVSLCRTIVDTYPVVYVLQDVNTNDVYLSDDSNLIKYDKYWFDDHPDTETDSESAKDLVFQIPLSRLHALRHELHSLSSSTNLIGDSMIDTELAFRAFCAALTDVPKQ